MNEDPGRMGVSTMGPAPELPGPDEPVAITRGELQALLNGHARNTADQVAAYFREAMRRCEDRLNAEHLDRVRDLRLTIRKLRRELGKPLDGKS